jgi:type I restriction enzyme S subunit
MSSKTKATATKEECTPALVPKLRFPEFRKSEEWSEEALSDVATIVMGSSPKSECYNQSEIGLPLLQGNADIKNRLSAPRIFTSEITKECTIGDILLSVRAPVGSVAKSIHHACIGRGIAAIRADRPNFQEFVYQWLLSYEPRWGSVSQGGTFDAVNSDDLKGVALAVPKPPEQQKIAECLSSVDELIAAQARKLDALKTHKKGLMQQLFPREGETQPRLRFPEFQNAGEWVDQSIGDFGKVVTGSTPSTAQPAFYGGGIPFASPADISDMRYVDQTKTTLTAEGFAETRHIRAGSVLFVCIGSTIGKAAQNVHDCATNQQINAVVPSSKHSDGFVYFALSFASERIALLAGRQAVPIINKSLFSSVRILAPALPEQQRIADCLTSLDDLIAAQTQKHEALKTHKKGLMQQLFPSPEEVAG